VTWEPDYVSLAELKSYLDIDVSDTAGDALLSIHITTASGTVNGWCHRQFGKVAGVESREYAGTWDRHLCSYVYEIDDVQTIGSMVVVDANANEITDYTLGPVNALQKGKPYERLYSSTSGPLLVQALWGWTDVPVPVKNATLIQAARLAKRKDSPFGVAGSPSQGSELRLLAKLDPDACVALGPKYRREVWAA
jgi:hypothetical protein